MLDYLKMAAKIAMPIHDDDPRSFWLGSVGIRDDGVLVSARNGAVQYTSRGLYKVLPRTHAEVRCLAKCDKHSTIYVARVKRADHSLAMARPCHTCQQFLKAKSVKKVFYTINDFQYGIWFPMKNKDVVFTKNNTRSIEVVAAIMDCF